MAGVVCQAADACLSLPFPIHSTRSSRSVAQVLPCFAASMLTPVFTARPCSPTRLTTSSGPSRVCKTLLLHVCSCPSCSVLLVSLHRHASPASQPRLSIILVSAIGGPNLFRLATLPGGLLTSCRSRPSVALPLSLSLFPPGLSPSYSRTSRKPSCSII